MFVFFSGIGGLGNSLFQLAAAIYYCEKYNFELKMVKTREILYGTSNMFSKTKCLKINNEFITYDKTIFNKIQCLETMPDNYIIIHNDYTDNLMNPEENNILITGYNQNLNLFNTILNKIPKYLNLEDIQIKNYIYNKYPNIENSTILCVRIGEDFKHMNKIIPESYVKAIQYLNENGEEELKGIFVLSDISTQLFFNNKLDSFIEINEADIIQIYSGLLCKNLILSESTFHLWIAYLGMNFANYRNKKVICFNNTDITNRKLNLDNWVTLDY
jgi:hypothetical protein